MKSIFSLASLVFLLGSCASQKGVLVSKTPDQPAPRVEDYDWMPYAEWKRRHEALKSQALQGGIEIAFFGDSITEAWPGTRVWKEKWEPRKAAAFGIGGDRTQNLLWRIGHGEAEHYSPSEMVLLIGTNNFGHFDQSAGEVARGAKAVAHELKKRFPSARLWVMGIFPTGEKADHPFRQRIRQANAELRVLDDGKGTRFLDIEKELVQADGSISSEIMPDFLHLSEKGYEIWTRELFRALALQ